MSHLEDALNGWATGPQVAQMIVAEVRSAILADAQEGIALGNVCKHCGKPIRWSTSYKEWVHIFPGRELIEPLCYGTGPENLDLACEGKALYAEPKEDDQ